MPPIMTRRGSSTAYASMSTEFTSHGCMQSTPTAYQYGTRPPGSPSVSSMIQGTRRERRYDLHALYQGAIMDSKMSGAMKGPVLPQQSSHTKHMSGLQALMTGSAAAIEVARWSSRIRRIMAGSV